MEAGFARRLAIALLVLLAALAPLGCASRGPADSREAADGRRSGRLLVGLGVEGQDARAGRLAAVAGRPVTFVVVLENRGADPARLVFPTGQSADLTISRDGSEVWRWSAGQAFTQAVREETLEAGGRRAVRVTWPGTDQEGRPVEPGRYEAVGRFTLETPLATPPLALVVSER
jgi:hypothetical protein